MLKSLILSFVVAVLLAVSPVAFAQLYSCKGEDGKTRYVADAEECGGSRASLVGSRARLCPLCDAAEKGNLSACPLCDAAEKGNLSACPLCDAAEKGNLSEVKRLLENEASVKYENIHGDTALILAAKNGHGEVVKLLLENGADIDANDKRGNTALILAAENGHGEVAKLLLKRGAEINVRNYSRKTALDYAKFKKNYDIAEIIQQEKNRKAALQEEKDRKAQKNREKNVKVFLENLEEKKRKATLQQKKNREALEQQWKQQEKDRKAAIVLQQEKNRKATIKAAVLGLITLLIFIGIFYLFYKKPTLRKYIMTTIWFSISLCLIVFAYFVDSNAKSEIHQIYAVLWVIAAIICGVAGCVFLPKSNKSSER